MKRLFFSLFVLAIFMSFFASGTAEAMIIHEFSDLSSDETLASVLTATANFTVSGSQLLIDIDNTSEYQIAGLYFNTDNDLTELELVGGLLGWSVSGGIVQDQVADGFGMYNWLIDFGSGNGNRLGSGVTNLILNMTGTTSETTIGSKWSSSPPGYIPALAVMKFEAGPNDDSAFGATTTPIPEPTTMCLMGFGILGILGVGIKKRRKNR